MSTVEEHSILHTSIAPAEADAGTSTHHKSYTYYHAGPLFTVAELHNNVLLSRAILQHSKGKFVPTLPQDLEQRDMSPHSIRDEDLRALLSCDLALFTFDGTELDAGTVVEFMTAKAADIPAVILRTDFRTAGDQGDSGDAWNLMCSNWPRTVGVRMNAMVTYKACLKQGLETGNVDLTGQLFLDNVASQVVGAFEEVLKKTVTLPRDMQENAYRWVALMPGFKSGDNSDQMLELCKAKQKKGLL